MEAKCIKQTLRVDVCGGLTVITEEIRAETGNVMTDSIRDFKVAGKSVVPATTFQVSVVRTGTAIVARKALPAKDLDAAKAIHDQLIEKINNGHITLL